MSKWKSQIGSMPATKLQPAPLMPDRATWFTEPPIAGDQPRVDDWLQLPTPRNPPDRERVKRVARLRLDLHGKLRASRSKAERRTLRVQLGHVEKWLEVAASIRRAPTHGQESSPTPSVAPLPIRLPSPMPARSAEVPASRAPLPLSLERRAALDDLGRRVAQLQVRIDAVTAEQKGREARLADPTVYADGPLRARLLAEFERGEAQIAELQDRHETMTARIEALRDRGGGLSRTPANAVSPSASAVRARFGQRVRDLRTRLQITQAVLAERAGIAPHIIASIEVGDKATIGVDAMASLASALGSSLGEISIGVDVERPQALARISGALARLSAEDQMSILELVEVALGTCAEEP